MNKQAEHPPTKLAGFLLSTNDASALLEETDEGSIPGVFPINYARQVYYKDNFIKVIDKLKKAAIELSKIEYIMPIFTGVDKGLLSVGEQYSIYSREDYLRAIDARFSSWTYGNNTHSTEIRWNNKSLYIIDYEIDCFKDAGDILDEVMTDIKAFRDNPTIAELQRRIRNSACKFLGFQRREFTEIKGIGLDKKPMTRKFVDYKIEAYRDLLYNGNEDLAGLADVLQLGQSEFAEDNNARNKANSITKSYMATECSSAMFGEINRKLKNKLKRRLFLFLSTLRWIGMNNKDLNKLHIQTQYINACEAGLRAVRKCSLAELRMACLHTEAVGTSAINSGAYRRVLEVLKCNVSI